MRMLMGPGTGLIALIAKHYEPGALTGPVLESKYYYLAMPRGRNLPPRSPPPHWTPEGGDCTTDGVEGAGLAFEKENPVKRHR